MSNEITVSLLGKVIAEQDFDKARRDAVHIAVLPVIVGNSSLGGGSFVQLLPGTADTVIDCDPDDPTCIGIIDPFLAQYPVPEGVHVFVFLKPGTITGLSHRWSHPIIDAAVEEAEEHELVRSHQVQMTHDPVPDPSQDVNPHEQWLREFAARWNFNYDEMLGAANRVAAGNTSQWGDYVIARGRDLHSAYELGDDYDLFWHHYEGLTNRQVGPELRQQLGWSCSC